MTPVLIFGASGHAREIHHLCVEAGISVLGFLDERACMNGASIAGLPVFQTIGEFKSYLLHNGFEPTSARGICAGVGDPRTKQHFDQLAKASGLVPCRPIVHPSVRLGPSVHIGAGSLICEGVTMTVDIKIGSHVVVNRNSTIGHDVVIDDYVTVSPGVNVSGNVHLGKGSFIGTGSSIREKLSIGEWSIVGGGAFVASHVPARSRYAGVPAKPL